MSNIKHILVTVGANDDEYTSVTDIKEEVVEKFLPLIQAINDFKPYITYWGYNFNNFPDMEITKKDKELGRKSIYDIYSQFDKDYIDEFIGEFIHGDFPYGYYFIYEIKEIEYKTTYLDKKRDEMRDEVYDSEEYKKYLEDYHKYSTYRRSSDGKPLHCIPYSEMTEKELQMSEWDNNFWKKYRPDLEWKDPFPPEPKEWR